MEPTQTIVQLCQWQEMQAEADEMSSFVQSKTRLADSDSEVKVLEEVARRIRTTSEVQPNEGV
jgi:hypothetical protein